jgi:AraC family transcriptional regulator
MDLPFLVKTCEDVPLAIDTANQGYREMGEMWLEALERSYGVPKVVLPDLPDSGISLARWQGNDAAEEVTARHSLDSYTLSWILRPMHADTWFGERHIWSGNIAAQTFRLTPPGVRVRWQSSGEFDFLLLLIPAPTIERICSGGHGDIHAALAGLSPDYMRDALMRHLVLGMFEASVRATPAAYRLADALGNALVARLDEFYLSERVVPARERLSPSRLRRVRHFVDAHLEEKLSVRRLAEAAALSEAHFARAFRQETGMSPHQYVMTQRVARAQEMLRSSDESIFQIALQCGFNDASHFSRVFRKEVGINPTSYRYNH